MTLKLILAIFCLIGTMVLLLLNITDSTPIVVPTGYALLSVIGITVLNVLKITSPFLTNLPRIPLLL